MLYHTDLSRDKGMTVEGNDLEKFNWGAYDLVVIDESHNFRNGADTSSKVEDETQGNRFERLLNKVIKDGVETKVLMLSATPVNNRFRDLHNQLKLAYQAIRMRGRRSSGSKSRSIRYSATRRRRFATGRSCPRPIGPRRR